MRNFKVTLQYEGTRYQGWQKQESTENTIQGKLEALLSKMCEKKVEIHGSGRTDAGVHARGQVANFILDTDKSKEEIMEYMNQYLPEDIGIIKIEEANKRFHSRLHAKGKTYQYRIINSATPYVFDRRYVYQIHEDLDITAMREAALCLCGTHDFKAFTSHQRGKKSTVRTIESIQIEERGEAIIITFTGDGFLYHMIRILVGTLLAVGKGEKSSKSIQPMIERGDRKKAGELVPAKGLTLVKVEY